MKLYTGASLNLVPKVQPESDYELEKLYEQLRKDLTKLLTDIESRGWGKFWVSDLFYDMEYDKEVNVSFESDNSTAFNMYLIEIIDFITKDFKEAE